MIQVRGRRYMGESFRIKDGFPEGLQGDMNVWTNKRLKIKMERDGDFEIEGEIEVSIDEDDPDDVEDMQLLLTGNLFTGYYYNLELSLTNRKRQTAYYRVSAYPGGLSWELDRVD